MTRLHLLTREGQLHWLALRLIHCLGARKAGQLVAQFRTPHAIFRASRQDLEASGLPGSLAQTIASGCTFDDAVEQQQKMLETGATLVPITSEAYPARLREIYDPPLALFARGRIGLLQPVILGVVGIPRTAPSAMLSAIFSGVIPWRRRSTIGRTIFR